MTINKHASENQSLKKKTSKFINGMSGRHKKNLTLISVRMPQPLIDQIDSLVKDDIFLSRNEWIVKVIMKELENKLA